MWKHPLICCATIAIGVTAFLGPVLSGQAPDALYLKFNEGCGNSVNSTTADSVTGRPIGTVVSPTSPGNGPQPDWDWSTAAPLTTEVSAALPPTCPPPPPTASAPLTNKSMRFYASAGSVGRVDIAPSSFRPSTYGPEATEEWTIEAWVKYPGLPSPASSVRALCGDSTGAAPTDLRIVRGGFAGTQVVGTSGPTKTGIGITATGFGAHIADLVYESGHNPPGFSSGIHYGSASGNSAFTSPGPAIWPVYKNTWTKIIFVCKNTGSVSTIEGHVGAPNATPDNLTPTAIPVLCFTATFDQLMPLSSLVSALSIGGCGSLAGWDGWIDEFSIWGKARLLPDIATAPSEGYRANSQRQDIEPKRSNPFSRRHTSYAPYTARIQLAPNPGSPTSGLGLPVSNPIPSILLSGSAIVNGAIPVPWGDSVDLANPNVIADGFFGGSPFDVAFSGNVDMTIAFPLSVAGQSLAPLQIVSAEPLNPPFNVSNQLPFLIEFAPGFVTSYALGDDDHVVHTLPSGVFVDDGFAGSPILVIGSNGLIEFGSTPGFDTAMPDLTSFFYGFSTNGTPTGARAIAAYWTDLDPTSGGEVIVIDPTPNAPNVVRVIWKDQIYRNSHTPAGTFSCTFGTTPSGLPYFTIDVSAVMARIVGIDPDPIIGVTCGGLPLGGVNDWTLDFTQWAPYFQMPATDPMSVAERFGPSSVTVAPDFDSLTFFHLIPDANRYLFTIP